MIYGYARVSTVGQKNDGNSLENQTERLTENGAKKIYVDSFTGTKLERPEFTKLLSILQDGDTVIATKLDRISRSASQGIDLIDSLLAKGVKVHILNMGVMDNTPTGKLIRNIMFSFAEFERDMIVERTQEGKAIARQRPGYHEKPKLDRSSFAEYFAKNQRGEMTARECAKAMGISNMTWYNMRREFLNGEI